MTWDDEDDLERYGAVGERDEDPQECDLAADDADDSSDIATVACAHCRAEIVADLPQCPRCGAWSPEAGGRGSRSAWIIVGTALAAALIYSVLRVCSFGDR